MNPKFNELINGLDPKLQQLLAMDPVTAQALPKEMPKEGTYLFSEGDRHLYVGRSRNIRNRIGGHSRAGATHYTASFAFLLAREETGKTNPTYKSKGSREDLLKIPEFQEAFDRAKTRIRNMDLRFVEEKNSISQTLLEIYIAVSLSTPYNDFRTH